MPPRTIASASRSIPTSTARNVQSSSQSINSSAEDGRDRAAAAVLLREAPAGRPALPEQPYAAT